MPCSEIRYQLSSIFLQNIPLWILKKEISKFKIYNFSIPHCTSHHRPPGVINRSLQSQLPVVAINRCIYKDSQILFKEDPLDSDNERLTSSEMRRLYCALKAKYGAPIIAWFNNLDDTYSEIRISAQLPTREYYFMLLFAWPKQNAFNKTRFISKNSILPTIEKMLSNIGIEVRR